MDRVICSGGALLAFRVAGITIVDLPITLNYEVVERADDSEFKGQHWLILHGAGLEAFYAASIGTLRWCWSEGAGSYCRLSDPAIGYVNLPYEAIRLILAAYDESLEKGRLIYHVEMPVTCDCDWVLDLEDPGTRPCGCGEHEARLYLDGVYHFEEKHWRLECLMLHLAKRLQEYGPKPR